MSSSHNKWSRRELFRRLGGQPGHSDAGGGARGFDTCRPRADDCLRQGHYQQAAELYQRSLERDPDQHQVRFRLAYCSLKLGHLNAADQLWQTLLDGPRGEDSLVLLYAGMTHAAMGQVEQAIAIWKKFQDYARIHVQREINTIVFQHERGEELSATDLVARMDEAIVRQAIMPGSEDIVPGRS